ASRAGEPHRRASAARRRGAGRHRAGARPAGAKGPEAPAGDLQGPLAVADGPALPPSPAPLYAGLHPGAFHRFRGAARRPSLRRGPRHRRGLRPLRRRAGPGPRPPEGPDDQGKHASQLRDAAPGGLPEGHAADATRRSLPASHPHLHRHAGRLSGHRSRGARPGRGDRREPGDDGPAARSGDLHGDRGGRLGRRARHRRGQPRADAAVRRLLGHQPRGLLVHPVPGREQGRAGGRRAQAHRARPDRLRHRGRGGRGGSRRSAPRPPEDGGKPRRGPEAAPGRAQEARSGSPGGRSLRQVPRHGSLRGAGPNVDGGEMNSLVPSFIENLAPYIPGKPIEETEREYGVKNIAKLASNENPLGPSPKALEAMAPALRQMNLYPDASAFYLRNELAAFLEVRPEELVLGNGSNELIELLIRTFVHGDDEVLLSEHTFPIYKISAQAVGRRFVEVPMKDRHYDLEAMADAVNARTRMVFIANPDNPTGTYQTEEAVVRFLERLPERTLVVLDEAYYEYVVAPDYPNSLALRKRFPNLIVLRTFSKAYGLAGLRVGYGIARPEIVEYVNRTRAPFNVSTIAQIAARAALQDQEHVRRTVELNRKGLALL